MFSMGIGLSHDLSYNHFLQFLSMHSFIQISAGSFNYSSKSFSIYLFVLFSRCWSRHWEYRAEQQQRAQSLPSRSTTTIIVAITYKVL